jgi:hypothetical protein
VANPTGYAYLEGGPCDKTRVKLNTAEEDSGTVDCKGGVYHFGSYGQRPNGDIIAKYAGKITTTTTNVKAARAHKGWSDLRRSMNSTQPTELSSARRCLGAGLRTVARARKVKLR